MVAIRSLGKRAQVGRPSRGLPVLSARAGQRRCRGCFLRRARARAASATTASVAAKPRSSRLALGGASVRPTDLMRLLHRDHNRVEAVTITPTVAPVGSVIAGAVSTGRDSGSAFPLTRWPGPPSR